jgi:hypothetical protein
MLNHNARPIFGRAFQVIAVNSHGAVHEPRRRLRRRPGHGAWSAHGPPGNAGRSSLPVARGQDCANRPLF